ncbi:flagellar M-ring protein FliF [Motilibacter rhizosphaerae]|uniref:Flagellar M-ring protein n=1 Tax=Motilibacter rhizosphaerae TaxID=598652 RepID=A0A4Q7NVW5_9ACTN|nr:flagellar basal-body MS-ring/collar protein FliF [Motilibacter rhizosphaerae]RZS91416.1 flagellar M-ring protein FliF [Motilibacter rhizosphaerae]
MPKKSARLRSVADRPWKAFMSFTPGQRAVTVVAAMALLLGGFFIARWSSAPQMSPLFSALSAKDSAAISAKLDGEKVSYSYADNGSTIMVPAAKVDALRVAMAGAGLPADDPTGGNVSVLPKVSSTSPKALQDVALQQAAEQELGKTLGVIDGVDTAIVHLAVPQQDVFADDNSKTTASVLVKMQQGTALSSGQVRAMQNLVASSVPNLAPTDVSVTDATTGRLLSGDATSGAGSDDATSATSSFEDKESAKLQSMLDSLVGPGNAVVQVNADLNFDQTLRDSTSYVQPTPAVSPTSISTDIEKYTGNGDAVSGVLGPDNIGVNTGGTGAAAASPNTYSHEKSTANSPVDVVKETTKVAVGTPKRLSIAVLLNKNAANQPQVADVQKLVTDAAGLQTARGDTVTVSSIAFDKSAASTATTALKAAAAAKKQAALMGYVKTGGLVLVLLMTLLLTWLKARKHRNRTPFSKAELERLDELEQRNSELEAENQRLALEGASKHLALEASPEAEGGPSNEDFIKVRDEITDLVEHQPDEVAQLLRGWLADRRG